MAIATTVIYNSNAIERAREGDLITVVYECTLTGNYPANGELIDMSNEFREVFSSSVGSGSAIPWQFPPDMLLPFIRQGATAGYLILFATGAAGGAVLDELAAGAYPNFINVLRVTVVGRPVTDPI